MRKVTGMLNLIHIGRLCDRPSSNPRSRIDGTLLPRWSQSSQHHREPVRNRRRDIADPHHRCTPAAHRVVQGRELLADVEACLFKGQRQAVSRPSDGLLTWLVALRCRHSTTAPTLAAGADLSRSVTNREPQL